MQLAGAKLDASHEVSQPQWRSRGLPATDHEDGFEEDLELADVLSLLPGRCSSTPTASTDTGAEKKRKQNDGDNNMDNHNMINKNEKTQVIVTLIMRIMIIILKTVLVLDVFYCVLKRIV